MSAPADGGTRGLSVRLADSLQELTKRSDIEAHLGARVMVEGTVERFALTQQGNALIVELRRA